MKANLKTKTHVCCPSCDEVDSSIDHVINKDFSSMWYCNSCGIRYKIKCTSEGDVFVESTSEFVEKTLVFLKHGDIGLIVEGMAFDGEIDYDNQEYYYNESTCPTNYLKNVLTVIDLKSGDADPHGIFQHVDTIPWEEGVDDCNFDMSIYLDKF